ncbi:MAG: type IV pilin protein [Rubrivivax sp.]|nr:type IV pilin protein [Rubrivivax sp.]
MFTSTQSPGFTLVELAVAMAIAVLLASTALPALQAQLRQARRADAVAALKRVQLAQERFHGHHGRYASQLDGLIGAASPRSDQGLYDIRLQALGGAAYHVTASVRADAAQAGDSDCAAISLVVNEGIAEHRPSRQCWGR